MSERASERRHLLIRMESGQFDDAPQDQDLHDILPNQLNLNEAEAEAEVAAVNPVPNDREAHPDNENEYEYEYEDEDDDYYYDDVSGKIHHSGGPNANRQQPQPPQPQGGQALSKFQPADKVFKRYNNKINVDAYTGPSLNPVEEQVVRKNEKERYRVKDKADRATIEQVLDPRTRMILFKLLNQGVIDTINGCISTGKEANVYHCTNKEGLDRAIKVYKTSILVFKDREKYVNGEYRFRQGYGKKNPRKMVKTWAEKEMRNLTRLYNAGLRCPKPLLLRSHVLLMSFLGTDGWNAPRLQDVEISESKARELYYDLMLDVRKLFHTCKLVHGDLSEYNILLHDGKAYLIDVSQSVEHDHPHALEFLRKDLNNLKEFFRRKNVAVLSLRESFDFVVDPNIEDNEVEDLLGQLSEKASGKTVEEREQEEDELFKQIYIPRRLDEVSSVKQP